MESKGSLSAADRTNFKIVKMKKLPPPTAKLGKKNHNNYIAIAKAICIICVVLLHARAPMPIRIFVTFFSVPLFFFTSGYFYKSSFSINDLRTFYIKRIKGLYLPFIKWSLLFLLLHNICFHFNLYNSVYGYKGQTSVMYSWTDIIKKAFNIIFRLSDNEQLLGAFWFIRVLFITALMVGTADLIFRKFKYRNKWLIFCTVILLSYVAIKYNINFPWVGSIGLIFYAAGYYIMGYIYHRIESSKYYTAKNLLLMFAITLMGLFRFDYVVGMNIVKDNEFLTYTIVSITGIIFIVILSKYMEKSYIKRFLFYVGNNTMIILALHFTCFKLVSLVKIAIYNYPIERLAEFPIIEDGKPFWWLAYTVCGVFIPLIIQSIFEKVKVYCQSIKL